jgi:hypothetical protein
MCSPHRLRRWVRTLERVQSVQWFSTYCSQSNSFTPGAFLWIQAVKSSPRRSGSSATPLHELKNCKRRRSYSSRTQKPRTVKCAGLTSWYECVDPFIPAPFIAPSDATMPKSISYKYHSGHISLTTTAAIHLAQRAAAPLRWRHRANCTSKAV